MRPFHLIAPIPAVLALVSACAPESNSKGQSIVEPGAKQITRTIEICWDRAGRFSDAEKTRIEKLVVNQMKRVPKAPTPRFLGTCAHDSTRAPARNRVAVQDSLEPVHRTDFYDASGAPVGYGFAGGVTEFCLKPSCENARDWYRPKSLAEVESMSGASVKVTATRTYPAKPDWRFLATVAFYSHESWASLQNPRREPGPTEDYVQSTVALHEFGHLYGLDHEHIRYMQPNGKPIPGIKRPLHGALRQSQAG